MLCYEQARQGAQPDVFSSKLITAAIEVASFACQCADLHFIVNYDADD